MILIVGASGATGRLLTGELLNRGEQVRIIVRPGSELPDAVRDHKNLTVVRAGILDLSEDELIQHVKDCQAVASCLGHNITLKGVFGHPRRLVTEAVRRLCGAVKKVKPALPVKYVLMNTVGNKNRDIPEKVSLPQDILFGMLRILVPPQADNENAADFLRVEIGQNDPDIEWAAVRPDSLVDDSAVSDYEIFPSPIRSAIFNPGKTSRINVAHFMAELITNSELWTQWKGQMPVIYNKEKNFFIAQDPATAGDKRE